MPKFSKKSQKNLSECHTSLQRLFNKVIKHYDCTITDGHRGKKEQDMAYHKGWSKLKYPKSKHNKIPSLAADVVPYPIDYKNKIKLYHFGGYVKATADQLGIKIRWGGDWDSDKDLHDQDFMDLPHYELLI